jgi:hypothetical protein
MRWVRFRYIVDGDSVLISGVADPDPARRIHMFLGLLDPDPDLHQNDMDPQHSLTW